MNTNPLDLSLRCRGCLLGGAVGDALGAPVEFKTYAQIVAQFGPAGIRDFASAYGRVGAITDDTQMTLFTAEGLLRANTRFGVRGVCHLPSVVHRANLRWLKTQGITVPSLEGGFDMGGWLIQSSALWAKRAPGNTCLSALRNTKRIGEPATNDSKGCGGVMRVAPVGLVASRERAFEMGCETAALTHGHPSGYLSAGFLASLIAEIVAALPLQDAIQTAKEYLRQHPDHEDVLEAIEKAERLASAKVPDAVAGGELGAGWVAEEALAIALYCALASPDLEEAVVLAVNHSGDSDSTGAIAGNLCGALYGADSIPARWLDHLELRDEIAALANDLTELHEGKLQEVTDYIWERYPGG